MQRIHGSAYAVCNKCFIPKWRPKLALHCMQFLLRLAAASKPKPPPLPHERRAWAHLQRLPLLLYQLEALPLLLCAQIQHLLALLAVQLPLCS